MRSYSVSFLVFAILPKLSRCEYVFYVLTVLITLGCSSRYRLDLYLTAEEYTRKVKVEQTEFVPNSRLNDPYQEEKVLTGDANTAIITTGTRWRRPGDNRTFMFDFDEYLKCRLYVQLPQAIKADTIALENNSFVHLLGRYELPPEAKIFLPVAGSLIVDSSTVEEFFATIDGHYENRDGVPLEFEGQFKVKTAR
jgi:hypothetical protein